MLIRWPSHCLLSVGVSRSITLFSFRGHAIGTQNFVIPPSEEPQQIVTRIVELLSELSHYLPSVRKAEMPNIRA
jgi:hypothetical protein